MKQKHASTVSRKFNWMVIAGTVAVVSACGGGGGSSSSSSSLTIQGTAAVGKALDGAAISIQCKQGSASTTSANDGFYTATISNGKAPCVITATKSTLSLKSITPGAGIANITPLTDLLTNYLATRAGTSVSNLLSNSTGTAILSDTKAIADAQTEIVNVIKTNFGVTVSTTNFLTATLTTPSGGTQSDADKDLDLLTNQGVLTSGGTASTNVVTATQTNAAQQPKYVPSTGATGAS